MKRKIITSILTNLAVASILTSCGSLRMTTTLRTKPEMKNQQIADGVKFRIVSLNVKQDKKETSSIFLFDSIDIAPVTRVSVACLQEYAEKVYPRLFGHDFTDLPVVLNVDAKHSGLEIGQLIQTLTFATIPFPSWAKVDHKVDTVVLATEDIIGRGEPFTLKYNWWRTVYTPLGIFPVLGFSDLRIISFPFHGVFLSLNARYKAGSKKLAMDSLTEAVSQSIRKEDPAKLTAASDSRKARIRQVDINGRTYWSYLCFYRSKDNSPRDLAGLNLFHERPTWKKLKPFETATVARMRNEKWRPITVYLRSMPNATTATVLLVDGKPSKVVIKKVDRPPLEDFIELPGGSSCGDIRRNNDILIEIKNSTLPQLIREKKSEYMIKLVTRIEKAGLRLNSHAQKLDNKVQKEMVTGGKVDTTQLSEMSALCRQRITIFKPILSVLKRAIHLKRTIEKKGEK